MIRITAFIAVVTCAAGCEEKDRTAPPQPVVDPIASPTPLRKVSVTGSAEFGSTIAIAGGATSASAISDHFTARWRAEVELHPDVDNTLSVTATDAAGNVSEATVVTVVQAASKPASVKLSFTTPVARAGELVGLLARVVDQYGNELPDAMVTFESLPALAAAFTIPGSSPPVTKAQGVLASSRQFVAFDLSAVAATGGQFQVTARAGAVSDTQVLTIRPAAAQSFSKLAFVPNGTALTVVAGQDASYTYEVVDLYGNVTTGPVSAFTNAPGAIVIDDGVSGVGKVTRLTAAGGYSVAFYLAGVGQKGALTLNVGTAPAVFVDLSASATLASPQTQVKVFARVRDAFGNVISCTATNAADLAFTAAGAQGGTATAAPVTCFNGSFQTSFTFTQEDNYAVAASWQPAGATAVIGNVFITVLAFDNTPPTVSVTNITVNGAPCTPAVRTPAGCDVFNNDTVQFDVVASDNTALAQVAYSVFFESTQSLRARTVFVAANQATATVTFRFGVNSNTIERSALVAMAMDRAGNIMNSSAVDLYTDVSATGLGGRTVALVTSGGPVNRPSDVAFAANGDLFIASRGNNQVLRLRADAGTPNTFIAGLELDYLVRGTSAGAERMWGSDRTVDQVHVFDPGAIGVFNTWASNWPGGGIPQGLAVLGALPSRGWVDMNLAADGDQLRITQGGATMAYQLQTAVPCTASATLTCVAVAAGATGAAKAAALQAAIAANAGSPVSALAAGTRVHLASKVPGEITVANTIAIAKSPGGSLMTLSASTLLEGHDPDLFVGNDNDNNLRRFLTAGGPFNGASHGAFNVGSRQGGLAVRDVWAAPTDAVMDLLVYSVDLGNSNRLVGHEVITTGAGTTTAQRFAVSGTTVAPIMPFNALWDTVLAPNGCLLASDDGNGNLYAIDTRTPTNFAPSVERIARGFNGPRGLTLAPNGDLVIAVDGSNSVLRLSPSSDPNDCF